MKCVMIIDPSLPVGIQVNTAASLGISLSGKISGLVGPAVVDADAHAYQGITNIPVPILSLDSTGLSRICSEIQAKNEAGLELFVFSDIAQKSLSYDVYKEKIQAAPFESITILGLCLYGQEKAINKITGNLRILR